MEELYMFENSCKMRLFRDKMILPCSHFYAVGRSTSGSRRSRLTDEKKVRDVLIVLYPAWSIAKQFKFLGDDKLKVSRLLYGMLRACMRAIGFV